MVYYSSINKDEILYLEAMWMSLEEIMLREIIQALKDDYMSHSFMEVRRYDCVEVETVFSLIGS